MTTTPQLAADTEPLDGRTARAVRTRVGLVDATIALVEEGDLRPTAPRIAEQAGVSVRSVFQHFDDLETLFSAVGARVVERLAALIAPIDATEALEVRIAAFAHQRGKVLESVTPINRAAILQLPTSATIERQFRTGHAFLSAQVEEVFAPELDAAGARRHDLLAALVMASSWASWNLHRTLECRSSATAEASMAAALRLLLDGATVGPGPGDAAERSR